MYLPAPVIVPWLYGRLGLRKTVGVLSHVRFMETDNHPVSVVGCAVLARCYRLCCVGMDPVRGNGAWLRPRRGVYFDSHRAGASAPVKQLSNVDNIFRCVQILSGVAQPIFQVLIPGYSEKWFNLRQRTTATMLMSICASPIWLQYTRVGVADEYRNSQPHRRRDRPAHFAPCGSAGSRGAYILGQSPT